MEATKYRIDVRSSDNPNWAWTAYLMHWDGTEWRMEDAEDGDTQAEAIQELKASNLQARFITNEKA
jgi:hypothetical protein